MSNSETPSTVRRRAPVSRLACPMALAADMLGDRWTMLILREAFYGVQRYDDMRADLDAPRSMLTDRLAKMVENGLLERSAYQEPGARVRYAYVLTEAGRELALTLMALSQWGERYALGKEAPIEIVKRDTGETLKVALVTEDNQPVKIADATITLRK